MSLEKFGYLSNKVFFPGINMLVKLDDNQFFRFDGFVDNLEEHTFKIFFELGLKYSPNNYEDSVARHVGLNLKSNSSRVKTSNIFLLNKGSVANYFNLGHEAVHSLIHLNKEQYFLDELHKNGFQINPFEKYSDEEKIADIGGLLTLHKTNNLNNVQGKSYIALKDEFLSYKK